MVFRKKEGALIREEVIIQYTNKAVKSPKIHGFSSERADYRTLSFPNDKQ